MTGRDCLLGDTYAGLNRYDDAIEAYRQALSIDPEDDYAKNKLGNTYTLNGQPSWKPSKNCDDSTRNRPISF